MSSMQEVKHGLGLKVAGFLNKVIDECEKVGPDEVGEEDATVVLKLSQALVTLTNPARPSK